MIDILYIHPLGDHPSFSKKYIKTSGHSFGFIPMGVVGILNHLIKNGFKVRGINLSVKKRVNPSFNLQKCLDNYKPKIVLIDIHWYVHIKHGLHLAQECKKFGCLIVVGGLSATLFYRQFLKNPHIDYVIKGEAEIPMLELANSIARNQVNLSIPNLASKQIDNPVSYCSNINNFDYMTLDWLEDKKSYLNFFDTWLMVGRGCPFDCKNCDGAKHRAETIYHRHGTFFRDIKLLIHDLNRVESETVNFSLDLELMHPDMIKEIAKHNFHLSLRNEFFQADIQNLLKIKDSFRSFDLVFSPTAGKEKERREYGKNFSNEELLSTLKKIEESVINGGVILYFTDYMVSPLKTVKLDEKARNKLIQKIEKILPNTLIRTMPQLVDPGTLDMEKDNVFEFYSK